MNSGHKLRLPLDEDICFLVPSKNSNSSDELPSSLRERFENTEDFEWVEDFPIDQDLGHLSSSLKLISHRSSLLDDTKEDLTNESLNNVDNEERRVQRETDRLLGDTLMGCLQKSNDIFQRKNIFENNLERIIEEVSNEAFSSIFNKSTLILNSTLKKRTKGTLLNISFENINKLDKPKLIAR